MKGSGAAAVTTSSVVLETEAVAVGWLVDQDLSHGVVMDSQSTLRKIEKIFI